MTLAGEPRKHVFQLRQLHLQTSLGGAGAMREYVEYQLASIDDFYLNGVLQVALLRRREFMIDNQDFGLVSLCQVFELLHFAVSKQSGCVDYRTNLKYFGHNRGPGARGQFEEFPKRFGRSR